MQRNRKLIWGKTAAIMGAIPLLIWAHVAGPDPGKSGVPGESTCNQAQCHVGTALNGGAGSVKVTFPNGNTYVPGVKQHLVVTIADPVQHAWGFQATVRLASNTKTMAGTLTSTDHFTGVVCGSSPTDAFGTYLDYPNAQVCPTSKPYAYIEHTRDGGTRIVPGSETYEFDWTPPATNVGNVTIYVAGNAANGNGNESGDHIYTQTYTLTPSAGGSGPSITGVASGASFQPGVSANSWVTITGTNLAPTTDTWDRAIVNGKLPILLDGVGIKVGGKDAYIDYISPTQINAVAPDVGSGSMQVTVTTPSGTSAAVNAASNPLMPAFFLWPGSQAVATHAADGSWSVKNGTFAGATTVPAKPGEYVVLWGTGFGPTTPAITPGQQTPSGQIYVTSNTVTATVNGAPAVVYGSTAALAPGFAGLYQVAVQIPDNAPDGDLPLAISLGGAQSPTGIVITVKR
jgi:uncharacterized protein (TIGR03437 family)